MAALVASLLTVGTPARAEAFAPALSPEERSTRTTPAPDPSGLVLLDGELVEMDLADDWGEAVECHLGTEGPARCFTSTEEAHAARLEYAPEEPPPGPITLGAGDSCNNDASRHVYLWSGYSRSGSYMRYKDVAYVQYLPSWLANRASSAENFTQCHAILYDYGQGKTAAVLAGAYYSNLVSVGMDNRADSVCLTATNVNQCP